MSEEDYIAFQERPGSPRLLPQMKKRMVLAPFSGVPAPSRLYLVTL